MIDGTIQLKSRVYSVINHKCFCYPQLRFMSSSVSYARTHQSVIVLVYYTWQLPIFRLSSYTEVLTFQKIKNMQEQHLISIPLMNHPLFLEAFCLHSICPLNFTCESTDHEHEDAALQGSSVT